MELSSQLVHGTVPDEVLSALSSYVIILLCRGSDALVADVKNQSASVLKWK
jgi:hypothetical protein